VTAKFTYKSKEEKAVNTSPINNIKRDIEKAKKRRGEILKRLN